MSSELVKRERERERERAELVLMRGISLCYTAYTVVSAAVATHTDRRTDGQTADMSVAAGINSVRNQLQVFGIGQ